MTVKVKVEISWGKRWTGSHYEETLGQGVYVTVMETQGNSFKGCPCGRTDDHPFATTEQAVAAAIADFIRYGRGEYLGQGTLTYDMVEVVATEDRRYITETVIFDGGRKEFCILNVNTGSFYSKTYASREEAEANIEHGTQRNGRLVRYVTLQTILAKL